MLREDGNEGGTTEDDARNGQWQKILDNKLGQNDTWQWKSPMSEIAFQNYSTNGTISWEYHARKQWSKLLNKNHNIEINRRKSKKKHFVCQNWKQKWRKQLGR